MRTFSISIKLYREKSDVASGISMFMIAYHPCSPVLIVEISFGLGNKISATEGVTRPRLPSLAGAGRIRPML